MKNFIFGVILAIGAITAGAWAYGETFSFAVIADPHIDGNPDHKAKFHAAINWIITNKNCTDIKLLFIAGDIAWGGAGVERNLDIAKAKLDELNDAGIPYIPIIGDNEVHSGCEEEFNRVFADQYRYLAGILDNWRKAPLPADNKYLQNFSFDYKYCHFICADFSSRLKGDEGGELHDFQGGSWPWVKNDIINCAKPRKENIVIMTHIGMFSTGYDTMDRFLFSRNEMSKITDFISAYGSYIAANYAGHIHQNWEKDVRWRWRRLYTSRITDETWHDTRRPSETNDQSLTVRWISVDNGGTTIKYMQHLKDAHHTGRTGM